MPNVYHLKKNRALISGKPNLIPGAYAPGIYKTYFQNIKNLVKKFSI
jgi:hypothetical protein